MRRMAIPSLVKSANRDLNTCFPRRTFSMMAYRTAVQMKGLGFAGFTEISINGGLEIDERGRLRAARRRVSVAKNPSTALGQEHEVGVKWKSNLGAVRARRAPWDACGVA